MFNYPCPRCGTTRSIHEEHCKYENTGTPYETFERYYTDILSYLWVNTALFDQHDMPDAGIPKAKLVAHVNGMSETHEWIDKHDECLQQLVKERRIADDGEGYRLVSPEERAEHVIPLFEPMRTIYECGPVDGCKDYAVYTMVSWTALKELDWSQAMNFLTEWLEMTNAWEREDWGEASIEALLNSKRHVHRGNLGWGDYAEISKQKIEQSDVESQFDATELFGRNADDYTETPSP